MKTDIKAIVGGALDGALGGALVLLILFALSWVAINRRVTNVEEGSDETSEGAISRPTDYKSVEGEEDTEDEKDGPLETLPDLEAALQQQKAENSLICASSS